MRLERELITVGEAQNRILQHAAECGTEEIALQDSFGRRLAGPLSADHDMPHFARSGMDGFAFRCADAAGTRADSPVWLEVIEEIPCGSVPEKEITHGTAARIMTGAHLPAGADAVIMLEMTESAVRDGKTWVGVKKAMKPGDNITPVGFETRTGELLLQQGAKIGAGETALLAAFGCSRFEVYKQPKVAIFSTGSELLSVDSPLRPGKIRNSNGFMIAAQVLAVGGIPWLMDPISDHADKVEERIQNAFSAADMVITTGGVSVGDYDIMVDLFERWKGKLLFNKVAMRPGSPTSAGVWQNKLLFALSGNPGACFVGFELFAAPAIHALQGVKVPLHEECTAILGVEYPKGNAYTRYIRGRSFIEKGRFYAVPAGSDKSGSMVSIKDCNCLIVIPPGSRGVPEGELVTIVRLDD